MLNFIKAVLAGVAIGLAGLVYAILAPLGVGYKIAGAFIFSYGLVCVCEEGLNLITGKFY